jgi:hypothetical protein
VKSYKTAGRWPIYSMSLEVLEERNIYLIPVSNPANYGQNAMVYTRQFILNHGVNVVECFRPNYIEFQIPFTDTHYCRKSSEGRF